MELEFIAIRVGSDNHMYFFFDSTTAFTVDSIAPRALIHALSCEFTKQYYLEDEILALPQTIEKRRLKYAFTTHGHMDHAGGNNQLARLSPETIFFTGDEPVELESFSIKPVLTPCHTLDSVCFVVSTKQKAKRYVLTGDFLFKLGCGRFFQGTARMFQASWKKLVEHVDDETIVLSGHDYYETNRRFAEQFYPIHGCESVFSTVGEEKKYNPFLNPQKTVDHECDAEERLAELRKLKDEFH